MAAMAMMVKSAAEIRPIRSPKFSRPTARPPRMTVKFSQERKVRSLAKKTLGSTRVGRATRLPVEHGIVSRYSWECWGLLVLWNLQDGTAQVGGISRTRGSLEKRLAGHFEGVECELSRR